MRQQRIENRSGGQELRVVVGKHLPRAGREDGVLARLGPGAGRGRDEDRRDRGFGETAADDVRIVHHAAGIANERGADLGDVHDAAAPHAHHERRRDPAGRGHRPVRHLDARLSRNVRVAVHLTPRRGQAGGDAARQPQPLHNAIGHQERGAGAHAELREIVRDPVRGVRAEPDAARAPERARLLEEHVGSGHSDPPSPRRRATRGAQCSAGGLTRCSSR